jgi:flagellar biosynthesis component FlhA
METKICSKCKEEKNVCDFYVGRKECKKCKSKVSALNYHSNLDKNKSTQLLYRKNNKERLNERSLTYYHLNYDLVREQQKQYREKNIIQERNRLKIWVKNNRKVINEYKNNKRNNDSLCKLTDNVRRRVNKFLTLNNITKKNKTFDIVGCTPEFLKEYIEKQFTEKMSWELMGKYIHIDHIIPLSSAKTEEEVYQLCHYTNLQPLWAEDNLRKGCKIL